ncbi:MAG: integrase arm-type DNA-binding domain-containing protein, partial [Sedimenticolaceae bacterium]
MAKHPFKALSALKVKNISIPGRFTDGKGLHLYVDKHLRKRWVLRVSVKGDKRIDMGLGGYPDVSLEEVRQTAKEFRRMARNGVNPVTAKKASLAAQITFEDCARKVHESHKHGWKNPKHGAQWISTLEAYVFPVFGGSAISKVTSADVLQALNSIWLSKPETARRVKQRIRAVMDWAKASGLYSGDNPVDGITKALPKQTDKPAHHKALPHGQVPAFLNSVRASGATDVVKLCIEFTILTAVRTNEALNATWGEC